MRWMMKRRAPGSRSRRNSIPISGSWRSRTGKAGLSWMSRSSNELLCCNNLLLQYNAPALIAGLRLMTRLTHLFAAFLSLMAMPAFAGTSPDFFGPRAGLDADTALYLDAWSGRDDRVEALRARLNQTRSEERRVGKGCRGRWQWNLKKRKKSTQ